MTEIVKFIRRGLEPAIPPPDYALAWMILQSEEYTLSADLLMSTYKRIDYERLRILVTVAFFPKDCSSVGQIRRLFFDPTNFIMSVSYSILITNHITIEISYVLFI